MFHIGQRDVGDGAPCFITFELGATHDGFDSAKRLIKHAAEAGGDAVKVQIFDPDRLVADKSQLFSYQVLKDKNTGELETVEEPLYEILTRRYLAPDQWRELKAYSDSLGIAFFATAAFDEDVELLESIGCHSVKIASADVNHWPLIRRAARTGMCIQLDTGMSTLGEVEAAVDEIRSQGNENIIIHQCPSGYPARLQSIHLNIIPTLKRMFPYPVAFSDHTPGHDMDIAAVALGANLVEKTITEDRMTRSVEHVMSIEPEAMRSFVHAIRDLEIAMGDSRRELDQEEKNRRTRVRRSLFLTSDAQAGQKLMDCGIEFRRPGHGIPPDRFYELETAVLRHDLPAGHMLKLTDLE